MARMLDKDILYEIQEIIQKEKIFHITDIFAFYTKITRATFYNKGFDKLDSIKKALDDNKVKTKQKMLNKWIASNNATLQISAFKLIGSDDDRRKLSQSHLDIKSGGEKIKGFNYVNPDNKAN